MQVFISYRRTDAGSAARLLADGLKARLEDADVFLDTRDIAAGDEWMDVLKRRVSAADVVLVVIGPRWAAATIERDRLAQRGRTEHDVVLAELETAFDTGSAVIPVLVDGASMPRETKLTRAFQAITRLNAHECRPGTPWDDDVARLVDWIPPRAARTS